MGNCRHRGLDQDNYRSKGPPLLHDMRFRYVPSQSIKALLLCQDAIMEQSVQTARRPRAKAVVLFQCCKYLLAVHDTMGKSSRSSEEKKELVNLVTCKLHAMTVKLALTIK